MPKDMNIIKYFDAYYSYKKSSSLPSGYITSCGKILSQSDDYYDIEIAWSENPHATIFGIVIPKGVVHSILNIITRENIDLLTNIDSNSGTKNDNYKLGDTIAIYWNDVFAYDDKYKGKHIPTPMLTEGILIEETDKHIILSDPETLNLKESVNHPHKKPLRYFIPKPMISEIKIILNSIQKNGKEKR